MMTEQSCIPTRRSTWPTYDPPPTARFLGSLTNPSIPELLAAQLDVEVGGPYEYGALLKLARSPDLKQELKQRLTSGIDALTDRLSSALEKFDSGVRARNPRQLQDKFMQEGAGLLAYGDLNTFFGGLEAIVGAPLPRVREAMAAEHTQQADSLIEFTTKNYGVTTTSATEWAFVVEPSSRPDDAWPVETKPVQERRRPMPIAELKRRVDERGVQLSEQGDPVLTLEEAPQHPHLKERGVYDQIDGVTQPMPAPRFSRTPSPKPKPFRPWSKDEAREILAPWLDDAAIEAARQAHLLD